MARCVPSVGRRDTRWHQLEVLEDRIERDLLNFTRPVSPASDEVRVVVLELIQPSAVVDLSFVHEVSVLCAVAL